MNSHVIGAIFRRNLTSYFSSPTGYVFICVFMLLCSVAAFWTPEFFLANLANLDQLSLALPAILLFFIPAITMSIWADERRQGTDELLLTTPATDSDVVLGKYLAAVAIYTVSLIFSMVSNLVVMKALLGDPDIGLFVGTYFGYWVVGLAMIAIGLVASFLTSNLTVAFVLGALFNLPLVGLAYSEVIIINSSAAQSISRWGIAEQFRDFSRGVISLSSLLYFAALVVVMLYVCMILIGRRHWMGGRDGSTLAGHFTARAVALTAMGASLVVLCGRFDQRMDVSSERLSQLSVDTRTLLRKLSDDKPVKIDAYVSRSVPEDYVQTRLNLLMMLREFGQAGGPNLKVNIHELDLPSDEANRAETQHKIKPVTVNSQGSNNNFKQQDIMLGAAFTCGLETHVVPFFDRGVPVEYELIRSIGTVAQQSDRKKIGVIDSGSNMFSGREGKAQLLIELEKQYEVVQVDPKNPIATTYDVLLVVQPTMLTKGDDAAEIPGHPPVAKGDPIANIIRAIYAGQPTVILEDPVAYLSNPRVLWGANDLPPSVEEKFGPQGAFDRTTGQMKSPVALARERDEEKRKRRDYTKRLWEALDVSFVKPRVSRQALPLDENEAEVELFQRQAEAGDVAVIWQDYNPLLKTREIRQFTDAFVFIEPSIPNADSPLNQVDAISSRLQRLLFTFPGAFEQRTKSKLKFIPLVTVGPNSGTISSRIAKQPEIMSDRARMRDVQVKTGEQYVIAARIQGDVPEQQELFMAAEEAGDPDIEMPEKPAQPSKSKPADKAEQAGKSAKSGEAPKKPKINVVLVADVDVISPAFFELRNSPNPSINFDMDNVSFVLNLFDVLAGDTQFVDIRKRRREHRSLSRIDDARQRAREREFDDLEKFTTSAQKEVAQVNAKNIENRKAFQEQVKKFNQDALKLRDQAIDINRQRSELSVVERTSDVGEELTQKLRQIDQKMAKLRQQIQSAESLYRQNSTDAKAEFSRKFKEINQDIEKASKDRERQTAVEIREAQNSAKLSAVLLPPIPPLLVAFVVYFSRRAREREGVSRARLK